MTSSFIARFYLFISDLFTTLTVLFACGAEVSVIAARYFTNQARRIITEEQIMRIHVL